MLYAMISLVLLTFMFALLVLSERIHYLIKGVIKPASFDLPDAQHEPLVLVKSTACYKSMFDMPVLFFPVCTIHLLLSIENITAILLAWLFVLTRCLYAFLLISSDLPLYRAVCAWVSSISLFGMWLNVLLNLPV